MRRLFIVVLAVLTVAVVQAGAVYQNIFSGSCASGSVCADWWTIITFDDAGLPSKAVGVCCDGSSWTKDLTISQNSDPTGRVKATLHGLNEIFVRVSADQEVDFQIVDIRTGAYVSPVHHYYPSNGQFEINISTLPTGIYGVAVIQNQTVFGLLPFGK